MSRLSQLAPSAHNEPHESYRLPAIDLYGVVHKGLRLALSELVTRMARTDADDTEGVQQTIDDLSGLLFLMERHAEHEERHLHRALEGRHAGASAIRAAEHERQHVDIARLQALALAVTGCLPEERARLYRVLQLRYARFVGENLVHMSDEELETQPQLEALYTSDELKVLHGQLVGSIEPEEYQSFMGWILSAVSPAEQRLLSQGAGEG